MTDITERLVFARCDCGPTSDPYECPLSEDECHCAIQADAKYEILRLRADVEKIESENVRLREALRPFAERADIYDPPEGDDDIRDWSEGPPHTHILIGDLRRARSAVKGVGNER